MVSENVAKNYFVLSPFFFPEPISTGKFNTDMVLALREKGHRITVICSHPLYPSWKPVKSTKEIEGIRIIRGGSWIKYPERQVFRRVVLEVWFSIFAITKIIKYRKEIDVLIPIFPPSLAFYFIRLFLKTQTTSIGIVHDLQEVYSNKLKGIFSRIIGALINFIEGANLRYCHKVIFLSKEMMMKAKDNYKLDLRKCEVQYPFVSINQNVITDCLGDLIDKNDINIVYSGALGDKQNPKGLKALFDYISKLKPQWNFFIFSQGNVLEDLKNENKNNKIKFFQLVDRENIEELYDKSTVQIIPQLEGTSKGSLPSKLPNILASSCKVLVITDEDSELKQFFEENDLKKVVTTWDYSVIFAAIIELIENQANDLETLKELTSKYFSLNSLINKL
ncbi:hypothetical protein KH5_08780 [Urechidicola sp. KH5]